MEFFLFWCLFAGVVGIAASNRGRSGVAWFFIAAVISPLLGLILVLVLPKIATPRVANSSTHATAATAATAAAAAAPAGIYVKCPECAEQVLAEARKCKHCGSALTPTERGGSAPAPPTAADVDQAARTIAGFGRRQG